MRQRTVSDLMTRDVVSVQPGATFKDVVKALADNEVTAVPVVGDDNRPLGVVSEADLLRYEARRSEQVDRLPDVLRRFAARNPDEEAHPATAGPPSAENLMTSPAVVARPEWSVVEAVRTMHDRGVKRLPVVDGTDRMVGLVSRADLVRVWLREDRAIRDEIICDILENTFRMPPTDVTVHVLDGGVTLKGRVERRSTVPVLMRLCHAVDGVVSVSEELEAWLDDSGQAA